MALTSHHGFLVCASFKRKTPTVSHIPKQINYGSHPEMRMSRLLVDFLSCMSLTVWYSGLEKDACSTIYLANASGGCRIGQVENIVCCVS